MAQFLRFLLILAALVVSPRSLASEAGAPPAPTTREACLAAGGAWDGVSGRGHVHGCNLPTSDGGKACTDSKECEGLCRNHRCTDHRDARGCGIVKDGRTLCID